MKCLKCQNDTFIKRVILAEALEADSKHNPRDDKFEILTCKKCNLVQWYSHEIVSGLKTLAKFECHNCKNISAVEKIIKPHKEAGSCEGKVLVRTCTKCGLSALYQIQLLPLRSEYGGRSVLLKQRSELAKSFACPICKSKEVNQSEQIVFVRSEPIPEYSAKIPVSLIFVTCGKCKHMMVFDMLDGR